jgi:cell division protein FtsB
MIDGKLTEMGRDPRNIQVIVARDPRGRETLSLRDVGGVFVDVGTPEALDEGGTGGGGGDGDRLGEAEREEPETVSSERSSPQATEELDDLRAQNTVLTACNTELRTQVSSLNEEVSRVREMLQKETERVSEMWRMNCAQVVGFDEAMTAKDSEIESLKARISELEASTGRRPMGPASVPTTVPTTVPMTRPPEPVGGGPVPLASRATHASAPTRRGKAPPINEFSGEDPECLLEDWLPSLEWASLWNAWSEEEKLMQLAGHLKGRALQEWNLLHPDQRTTFAPKNVI